MRHELSSIGHNPDIRKNQSGAKSRQLEDFVLEKSIFNNVFEKDIRRVFIYKKAERLAKAIHLVTPAFADSVSLKNRIDAIAVGLVDAAIVSSGTKLSQELLALSSVFSIARTGGLISQMNAEIIIQEAHSLLQEVASYEEPRLSFDEAPTLSEIAKGVLSQEALQKKEARPAKLSSQGYFTKKDRAPDTQTKGHSQPKVQKDIRIKDRQESVLSVIREKGEASIKDISTLIRGVSEKTIQRELSALVGTGKVVKKGERRWSVYSLY